MGLLAEGLDAGLVFMGSPVASLVSVSASVLSAGGVFAVSLYGALARVSMLW